MGERMRESRRPLAALAVCGALFSAIYYSEPLFITDNGKLKDKWRDTSPIDKSDPYWEINNNMSINGTQYKKDEVSPGKWQWIEDTKANDEMAEVERQRAQLFSDMQRRVLSDSEMAQAIAWGDMLNITPMVSFFQEEKQRELNEAFAQQARLRVILGQRP